MDISFKINGWPIYKSSNEKLDGESGKVFTEALLQPPEPNETAIKAAKQHKARG